MKKMYAVYAVAAAAIAVATVGTVGVAGAMEVKSSNDKASVTLYGQIDRGVLYVDDGNDDGIFHVDNDHSSSRIGLKAKAKPSDDITVGAKFEVEFQSNASNEINFQDESVSASFQERHIDFYADTNFGKLSIGQGDTASNGTAEVDLSGTGLVGYSGVQDMAGSFIFHDNNAMEYSGIKIKDVFDQMDGLSRKDRIRYDTPKFAGFQFSTSAGEDDIFDVAGRYSRKFGDTAVEAAVAWANPGAGKDYDRFSSSASVLFGFGLNLGVAYGRDSMDNLPAGGDDPEYLYGKIGYSADLFQIGKSSFSVDYGKWQNVDSQTTDEEATSYGFQFVQKVSDWSTEVYLGYRVYQLDQNGAGDYEDINALLTGVRIKF